jgi:hypothetical protein
MSSPNVIREALLLQNAYLYFFFASAVATAAIGLRLVQRFQRRALLTPAEISSGTERPERRHVVGALIFGAGWGIADACPGPIATQVGQGIWWALFTLAGLVVGVYVFMRAGARETEPEVDREAVPAQLSGVTPTA